MKTGWIISIWIILTGFFVPAQEVNLFEQGLKEVGERHFAAAEKAFDEYLRKHPTNYAAAYNAGNCKLELRKYGDAILMFEKTLKYHPGDKNALRNLEYCYLQLKRNEPYQPPYGSYATFAARVGSGLWFWLLISSVVILCVLILLFFTSSRFGIRRFCLLAGFLLVLVSIFAGVNLRISESRFSDTHYGIVVRRHISTYPSPAADPGKLELQEGERVRLIEKHGGFTLVRLEDGHEVYVQTEDVELI